MFDGDTFVCYAPTDFPVSQAGARLLPQQGLLIRTVDLLACLPC